MDGLSIITGIALVVFLLFFFAFNLGREHIFLKILTVFAGIFMLIFIPQATIDMDKDCSISNDGTYTCFYSNGTQVSDYEGGSKVGKNFTIAFAWYLTIFVSYLFVYYSYTVLRYFDFIKKPIKMGRKKHK